MTPLYMQGITLKQATHYRLKIAASIIACSLTIPASLAQGQPAAGLADAADPVRWYQEDLTPNARFQTLKKEVDAAYKEALNECKTGERATRAACMNEARAQQKQDIASARQKMQDSRR